MRAAAVVRRWGGVGLSYIPPDSVVGGVLHSHLAHLLHLLLAASPGEQRQVVAPNLRVVAIGLQSPR